MSALLIEFVGLKHGTVLKIQKIKLNIKFGLDIMLKVFSEEHKQKRANKKYKSKCANVNTKNLSL